MNLFTSFRCVNVDLKTGFVSVYLCTELDLSTISTHFRVNNIYSFVTDLQSLTTIKISTTVKMNVRINKVLMKMIDQKFLTRNTDSSNRSLSIEILPTARK
jgi:hypothetical protein